jgi:hypothetical protein
MARQLVRSTEALHASWVRAGMWLLARVRADVSGLMFESVECLVADVALVGTRHVLTLVVLGLAGGRVLQPGR